MNKWAIAVIIISAIFYNTSRYILLTVELDITKRVITKVIEQICAVGAIITLIICVNNIFVVLLQNLEKYVSKLKLSETNFLKITFLLVVFYIIILLVVFDINSIITYSHDIIKSLFVKLL